MRSTVINKICLKKEEKRSWCRNHPFNPVNSPNQNIVPIVFYTFQVPFQVFRPNKKYLWNSLDMFYGKKIICLEIHYRENNTSNDMKKRNSSTEQRKNDKGIKICALKGYSERKKSVSPFWIFVRGLYFDMGFWGTFHFKLLGN